MVAPHYPIAVVTEVVDRGTKLLANCQLQRVFKQVNQVEDNHRRLGSEAVTQKSRLQQVTGQVPASLHLSKRQTTRIAVKRNR